MNLPLKKVPHRIGQGACVDCVAGVRRVPSRKDRHVVDPRAGEEVKLRRRGLQGLAGLAGLCGRKEMNRGVPDAREDLVLRGKRASADHRDDVGQGRAPKRGLPIRRLEVDDSVDFGEIGEPVKREQRVQDIAGEE